MSAGAWRAPRLEVKSDDDVLAMRRAGLILARALAAVAEAAVPGATPAELDQVARQCIIEAGARPSFLDVPGYRHTLCVSVNDTVVHGIPDDRPFEAGDVVSIDGGAVLDGWHADSALTVLVGGPEAADPADLALSEDTRSALWAGVAAFVPGGRIGDVGAAVQGELERAARRRRRGRPYGIVTSYEGHGIGRELHMEPGVPNVRSRAKGARVREGAVVAIEPMVTTGRADVYELADDWTVVTHDGGRAAHWEHTVAAMQEGPWVLTALDGGRSELAARGVSCGAPDGVE